MEMKTSVQISPALCSLKKNLFSFSREKLFFLAFFQRDHFLFFIFCEKKKFLLAKRIFFHWDFWDKEKEGEKQLGKEESKEPKKKMRRFIGILL